MLQGVHVEMMNAALDGLVSTHALKLMIKANVGVDAIWNQLGRHELHFDDNAFEESYRYMDEQRKLIRPALEAGEPEDAWSAFGRLTHTAQDFYSHSNYVDLWMAGHPPGGTPPAAAIEPLDGALLNSPALRSGRINLPLELLAYLPVIGSWIERIAPHDSHASMHLDSAARGPKFEYAFEAAVKRTRREFDEQAQTLPGSLWVQFCDLAAAMGGQMVEN
jgi:hypothetical protein